MTANDLILAAAAVLALVVIAIALASRRRRRSAEDLRAAGAPSHETVIRMRQAIANHAVSGTNEDALEVLAQDDSLFETELVRALATVSGSARDRLSALAMRHDIVRRWSAPLIATAATQGEKMAALERLALISDPSAAVAITLATRDKDLTVRDLAARILGSSEFAVPSPFRADPR